MNVPYRIAITPTDVGQRVTVRARMTPTERGQSLSDTVGVLVAWEHGVLEIERRDGTRVCVREADIVAAKRIPPAPGRRP